VGCAVCRMAVRFRMTHGLCPSRFRECAALKQISPGLRRDSWPLTFPHWELLEASYLLFVAAVG
jgi:hypothetical protein